MSASRLVLVRQSGALKHRQESAENELICASVHFIWSSLKVEDVMNAFCSD